MTDTPKIMEVDCSTGIATERDMTADELAAQAKMQADHAATMAAQQAAADATAAAKASAATKLTALGLTADEIAALQS